MNLTDRLYWLKYWENYEYEKVPSKVPFEKFLPRFNGIKSFIEIGGFPGVYASMFYKRGCYDVSVLDFFIDQKTINHFEEINDIPKNSISCIESDFFAFKTKKRYDLVFSNGFIEHFDNTKEVISRHCELLSDSGKLLIILPNFLGLNGFIQYLFDRETLYAHNLNSMKIPFLKKIVTELGLKNIQLEYTRKPMVWLEPKVKNAVWRKFVKAISFGIKLFPIKCRLLSPYIVIYAEK
ncbi:MAG: class I SAM-dependent methyltransferase [Dysgonamonadaceae bacterium]|jgi:SAM-dependent methyltransferase|nr:class I SAM-dependent methyltransferase [Dysgonamonadaceae bacterium]